MRIAFRFDANNEMGMGHAVRCSALAEAFIDRRCTCVYFCRENLEISEFTAQRGFGYIPVPIMGLLEESYWMQEALTGFDAVIIDSYFVSNEYINLLCKPGFTVVCYDDNALYEYSCDAVINGNLHAPELPFRFGNKIPTMLIGGEYTLLRREFRGLKPIEIREYANRVFICFGGSDVHDFTPKTIKALRDISGIEIFAVLGAMTVCDGEAYAEASDNVRIIKNPLPISDIMQWCDIAVTAGGSMVYELAALGIPSVVVVQAENQELIAGYLKRKNLMKVAGDWKTIDSKSLRDETERLLGDADRRRSENTMLINSVSRKGAENAVSELLKIVVINKSACQ